MKAQLYWIKSSNQSESGFPDQQDATKRYNRRLQIAPKVRSGGGGGGDYVPWTMDQEVNADMEDDEQAG